MVRRFLLVIAFVFAVLTGYVVGQKGVKPLPGGPIFSGGDLGFRADVPLGELSVPGRDVVTGTFVVKVDGRWVEARPRARTGVVPVR